MAMSETIYKSRQNLIIIPAALVDLREIARSLVFFSHSALESKKITDEFVVNVDVNVKHFHQTDKENSEEFCNKIEKKLVLLEARNENNDGEDGIF